MDYKSLEALGVDRLEVMDRLDGDEEFYQQLLKKYLEDSYCTKLEESFAQDDPAGAFHAAHTLRGVAAGLGLGRLRDQAADVTEELRGGAEADYVHVAEQIAKVRQEHDKAIETIKAL